MAVDLELLAAQDANFLLDDATPTESGAQGEPDDVMADVWGNLGAQSGVRKQKATNLWSKLNPLLPRMR